MKTVLFLAIVTILCMFLVTFIQALMAPKRRRKRKPKIIWSPPVVYLDNTEFEDFMTMKKDYIRGPIWDKKRKEALKRDNYTCQGCQITDVPLQVHHTSGYGLIPNEGLECLVSLCFSCHEKQHEYHGFPSTLQEYKDWKVPIIRNN